MQVYNRTPYLWFPTMGMDVAGREYLSFVIKGSFAFPDNPNDLPEPLSEQVPLVTADTFKGEPGFSATLWETDFAFRKANCDVVVQGAAYAPGGKPATKVQVGLRVGQWSKSFNVIGPRNWVVVGPTVSTTRPHPFTRQEFSYDTAFGGADLSNPDDDKPPAYVANPSGCGYASPKNQSRLTGQPLPNTEELHEPVTSPYESYRPMALGPVTRGVPQRLRYGGTYDKNWEDNIFPFLPPDFDERYYQQVGEDQQIAPPAPHTEVVLLNLTPQGREGFRLPDTRLPLRLFRGSATALEQVLLPDSLLIDPEQRRFSLTWRAEVPIKRHLTEFSQAWIGAPTRGLLRAHDAGKRYVGKVSERANLDPVT
ncbi:DUF2169 domain-containing protein [Rhodobacteraceae bacterium D3-12]|nr:DUF2169 domain-containing protein [Rhodobacteraceae bacterium D3-12]